MLLARWGWCDLPELGIWEPPDVQISWVFSPGWDATCPCGKDLLSPSLLFCLYPPSHLGEVQLQMLGGMTDIPELLQTL